MGEGVGGVLGVANFPSPPCRKRKCATSSGAFLPHCAMVDALIEVQIELFWPASFAPKKNCPAKGGTKKNSQENPPLLRMVGGKARFNARFFRTSGPLLSFFLWFF